MKLFYAQISWYDEYYNKNKEQHVLVPGINYSDAVKAIESQFNPIDEISLKEVTYECGDRPIIFLPNNEEVINAVIDENKY